MGEASGDGEGVEREGEDVEEEEDDDEVVEFVVFVLLFVADLMS